MSFDFFRLDNGVRVVLVPMAGVESTGVGVFVGTGSRHEVPGVEGVSHFLEHLAFKGTKKYPTYKDIHFLEGLGAIQNAWTDVDATAYWTKVPADKWKEALDVDLELVLNPTIPEKEMETERGVILEEIKMYQDRPDVVVGEELQSMMFEGNNLSKPIIGKPEVIKSVKKGEVLSYHDAHYTSENIVVAIAGKIEKFDAAGWLAHIPKAVANRFEPFVDTQNAPRVRVKNKSIEQVHLELGFPTFSMNDSRRFAAVLLASILGRGATSRLFDEVREKRGLCYTIHASANFHQDVGMFDVYAGLGTENLSKAIEAIMVEIRRICEEKVGEKELFAAKEKVRGPLLFSAENTINQMEFFARQALHRPQEILDYQMTIERVLAVDADQIQNVAQSIFLTQKLNLAVVGPLEQNKRDELLQSLHV